MFPTLEDLKIFTGQRLLAHYSSLVGESTESIVDGAAHEKDHVVLSRVFTVFLHCHGWDCVCGDGAEFTPSRMIYASLRGLGWHISQFFNGIGAWRMPAASSLNWHGLLEEDPVANFVVLPNYQTPSAPRRRVSSSTWLAQRIWSSTPSLQWFPPSFPH